MKEGIKLLASLLQPIGIGFQLELKMILVMHLINSQEGLVLDLLFTLIARQHARNIRIKTV